MAWRKFKKGEPKASHRDSKRLFVLKAKTLERLDAFVCLKKFAYCWFASDVTAAMLVVKNKRVYFRWEMNSILMQILQKNFFCIDHQHGRLVTWLQTKNCGRVPWLWSLSLRLLQVRSAAS